AFRSPSWARSTSRLRPAVDSPAGRTAARIASSAISRGMPPSPSRLTRSGAGGAEAHPAFAGEALDVDHPLQGNRVAAVLRLEGQRGLPAAGAQLGGAECLLQRVGARRRDERTH